MTEPKMTGKPKETHAPSETNQPSKISKLKNNIKSFFDRNPNQEESKLLNVDTFGNVYENVETIILALLHSRTEKNETEIFKKLHHQLQVDKTDEYSQKILSRMLEKIRSNIEISTNVMHIIEDYAADSDITPSESCYTFFSGGERPRGECTLQTSFLGIVILMVHDEADLKKILKDDSSGAFYTNFLEKTSIFLECPAIIMSADPFSKKPILFHELVHYLYAVFDESITERRKLNGSYRSTTPKLAKIIENGTYSDAEFQALLKLYLNNAANEYLARHLESRFYSKEGYFPETSVHEESSHFAFLSDSHEDTYSYIEDDLDQIALLNPSLLEENAKNNPQALLQPLRTMYHEQVKQHLTTVGEYLKMFEVLGLSEYPVLGLIAHPQIGFRNFQRVANQHFAEVTAFYKENVAPLVARQTEIKSQIDLLKNPDEKLPKEITTLNLENDYILHHLQTLSDDKISLSDFSNFEVRYLKTISAIENNLTTLEQKLMKFKN